MRAARRFPTASARVPGIPERDRAIHDSDLRCGTANQRHGAVYLKQIFLRALNTALFNTPCLMSLNIENSGAQFFAIYRAEGQRTRAF